MAEVIRFFDADGVEVLELEKSYTSSELAGDAYDRAVADLNHGNCGDAVKVVYGSKQHSVPTPAGSADRVAAEEARAAADAARAKRAKANTPVVEPVADEPKPKVVDKK